MILTCPSVSLHCSPDAAGNLRPVAIETIGDRYEVLHRLGAGGMGDVWQAHDLLLGRPVAIKFVGERELRDTPNAREILRDEAKHAGRLLGNPQIVSVLDLIDVKSVLHEGPAIILEFMDGCNLGHWISTHSQRLDPATRNQANLYIALEVTEAIRTAHKLQILHRDVKPQNILCSSYGQVKVTDFGLSRVVEEITRTHTVWARHTPLYAAPEQWDGQKPNHQTDVYQLAATLYHLFAAQPVNEGVDLVGLLRWHESSSARPLAEHNPDLNSAAAEIIDLGLQKAPGDRPEIWKMFDAFSNAVFRTSVDFTIDVADLDDESIGKVWELTDFNRSALMGRKPMTIEFPHPFEALRESIGATILGARCTIREVDA